MILLILKSIVAFVILMLIGTNLIGLLVRSFFVSKKVGEIETESVKELFKTDIQINKSLVLFSIVIILVYFYCLFHFYNIGILIAGIILMIARLPDLLWEIKNGVKISKSNMPKKPIDAIAGIMTWLSLPLIWISFYLNS